MQEAAKITIKTMIMLSWYDNSINIEYIDEVIAKYVIR